MWWHRRQDDVPAKEVTIRAHLETGETLQITLHDRHEPGRVDIEGRGEVRLTIRSPHEFSAEVVRTAG